VVLKVDSPQIVHKTESGSVRLNIRGEQELLRAFAEMEARAKGSDPALVFNGILVQQMIQGGLELILGTSEDPLFGPVLTFGWGGILVEALRLVAWRVCPIGPQDAREMIREIPGLAKVLGGTRGRPPYDLPALIDAMVRVSVLAGALKGRVSSIDFNPLMVLPQGEGVAMVDCRMVLRPGASGKH